MNDYIERPIDEKRELELKLSKLAKFLLSKKGMALPEEASLLLERQLVIMEAYLHVLNKRLKH